MQNRPKLRFKEFNDVWSNTTLGDVCAIYDGTHQTPDYKESGVQFLSVENIKDIDASNKFISEEDFRRDFKIKPEVNDILMTRIGDIGTSALVKTNKDYAYYVSLALLKCKNDILPSYLLQAIVEDNFQRQLWKNTLHVAFPKKINKGDIGKCKIKHPSLPEQQKIAEFLSKVDEVIAERKAEVKDLEQKKKGLMQKLFSQQLRFTDSNNQPYPEWKEKQVKDIAVLTSSKRIHVADYVSKGILFFRGKEISELKANKPLSETLYISAETYEEYKNKYGVPVKGDVLITAVGTLGNVWAVSGEFPFYFKDGNLIWFKEVSMHPKFLEYLLSSPKGSKKVLDSAIGSNQKALTIVNLNKLKFLFPCLEEQEKIANVLSKLDELIEERKALLSDWQQFKKGLLQQMFV